MFRKPVSILILLFLHILTINGQNLIVNPGAELDPLTNGWSEGVVALPTNAFHWTRSNNLFGEVVPRSGSYHFYANDNSNGNYYLYQDVDVSAYATQIDAGTCPFTFSFWTRMYNYNGGIPNDAARAYVEYRDALGNVLSLYDSGWRTHLVWTQVTDTRTAPAGTRTIRIRLQSGFTSGSGADGYFDDLSLTTPVTLPVTWIHFEARAFTDYIQVNWATGNEKENALFILQRSADGTTWENISQQEGAGESTTQRIYHYVDEKPVDGINYYRLQQIDNDGSSSYSKVISCSINKETAYSIFPNPCPQDQRIQIIAEGNTFIQIYSINGENVFSGSIEDFDSSTLGAGVYFLVIEGKEKTQYERLIIQ